MASPQAAAATLQRTTPTSSTAPTTGPTAPTTTANTTAETNTTATATTDVPATSNSDDGLSRRPRDARLIHLILSAQGIHSYQERVPLQLLDFAYRYTSSVLSDALRLSAEGYTSSTTTTTTTKRGGGGGGGGADAAAAAAGSDITVNSLRQAIASRQDYHFHGALPKDFMLEQASEKNRIALPKIGKSWGVQLPPEKYCLTGTGWSLKDMWDSDEEQDGEDEDGRNGLGSGAENGLHGANGTNGTASSKKDDGDEREDEGMDSFEDVFGGSADQDQDMADV
ncbi:hypothetical protein AAFC00_000293 [Neodothiora populina]|uniref:TFIID-31kDa-domain-containing protein n=1 Tax=Neodothiora populina TaxID=2781224 RepID=A0ABR3PCF9_9PEZI